MELKTYLREKKAVVDEALARCFPDPSGPASDLIRAMKYSLFAGGKRLRPILCIAGAEAVGGTGQQVLPVACAIELIQTYSLIHDDMPVMDDDDLRRGKPTCHKVFGDALALLAGDGLLTEAFHLMASEGMSEGASAPALIRAMELIASGAGYRGMVGGQVADIQMQGIRVDLPSVMYIHTHKTAALITASVVSGAVLAGGSEPQVEAITTYGNKIGLAFQISDDILNIESDCETLGKGTGTDAEMGKATYPSVEGLTRSKEVQSTLVREAVDSLREFDRSADPLRTIATYIIERKK